MIQRRLGDKVSLSILEPPPGFRPVKCPRSVTFSVPPALRKKRYTGRRAEGVRYEKRVQAHLETHFGFRYLASPWLRFFDDGKWRWCQPDGLVIDLDRGVITIVEVKYQHVELAWWQTKMLYGPVLAELFPPHLWKFEFCEVVKWYDPSVLFPEPVVLACVLDMPHPGFKVHIWKP